MAGITLEQAQAHLDAWLAAELAVASSQSYTIDTGNGSRSLTRADAAEISKMVTIWDQRVKSLTPVAGGGRRRVRYIVPE